MGVGNVKLSCDNKEKYVSTYVLHSNKNGILKDIRYSENINIIEINMEKKIGDRVEKFDNAEKLLGIIFLNLNL